MEDKLHARRDGLIAVFLTGLTLDIEERVGTSTSMDKQYVWAALSMIEAGSGYIDQLVCRDDATPQRLYACQDANFNLAAITDDSGDVVERYVFDPYGMRAIYDGTWAALSGSRYSWDIGHQGLMQDEESGLVYVRHRYLQPDLGTWLQRDPIGYLGGVNLYEYARGLPGSNVDPDGTYCRIFPNCGAVYRSKSVFLGTHCGLVVQSNLGTWDVDGSGGHTNTIGWVLRGSGSIAMPAGTVSVPDSVCTCLGNETVRWNGLRVPRDNLAHNSNWTSGVSLGACGLTLTFTGGPTPRGWDCTESILRGVQRIQPAPVSVRPISPNGRTLV